MLASIDWQFIWDHRQEFVDGLQNTLKVSVIGIVLAFLIGAVLGAARAHRLPVLSQVAAVYVELVRNTPLLVQVFLLYFGMPQFGIRLTAFQAAWISVTIWGGALSINTYVAILKNTAILGPAIGFAELTNQAYNLESTYFKALEVYLVLALVYLVIVWAISIAIRALESKLALPEGT